MFPIGGASCFKWRDDDKATCDLLRACLSEATRSSTGKTRNKLWGWLWNDPTPANCTSLECEFSQT